jgi:hypothetical protein
MTSLSWDDDGAQEGLLTKRSAEKCLTDREVEDFLFNRLSGVTREVVEEHLLVCHRCLDRVEDEEANRVLIRDAATHLVEAELNSSGTAGGTGDGGAEDGRPTWLGRRSATEFSFAIAATVMVGLLVSAMLYWQRPSPPVEVALWVERGEVSSLAEVPSGRPLHLTIDLTTLPQLPAYRLELVNARGQLLSSAELKAEGARLSWNLPAGYAAGRYWIRMRDAAQPAELLREFGLTVQSARGV